MSSSRVLAPGLKVSNYSNLTGLVSGVPTEAGVFSAWIALKDICGNSAELLFTFEIWVRRWGIATDSLKPATVGAAYSSQLQDQGITSNVTYEVTSGSLPPGITLSPGGLISGTPTAVGSSTFTVKGTAVSTNPSADGTRVDSKTYTLNVSSRSWRVSTGQPRSVSTSVSVGDRWQGPYTWSARPTGRALGGKRRPITGTPTTGSYPAQVTVTHERELEGDGSHLPRRSEARHLDEAGCAGEGRFRLLVQAWHEGRRWFRALDDRAREAAGGTEAQCSHRQDRGHGTGGTDRKSDRQGEGRRGRDLVEDPRRLGRLADGVAPLPAEIAQLGGVYVVVPLRQRGK